MPTLATRFVFKLIIKVAKPIEAGDFGYGARRVIPIEGGELTGEGMHGTIEAGGADYQIIRPNGFTELEAKYAVRMDDGAVIYVENIGVRFGPAEALEKIRRGELVDPKLIYFRSRPRFETGHPDYRWLMESFFVGSGSRFPDRVELDVFQVL
ncbi:MAG: hypothetical protein A4S14_14825 [Proteobacteria bacterium SG_bin9]|nr:MAG: hypothetical protein A4S14_14825 [Proteobacteria bacterium SG_bin9]